MEKSVATCMLKHFFPFFGITVLIIAIGIFVSQTIFRDIVPRSQPIACPMDAKLCPDGTAVGRVAPVCAFPACPESDGPSSHIIQPSSAKKDWKMMSDEKRGISFQYPEWFHKDWTFEFIGAHTWPPSIAVSSTSFGCVESGVERKNVALTHERIIRGKKYCVTLNSEGAAGSIYTTYTYATSVEQRTVTMTVTLRAAQCANVGSERLEARCEHELSILVPEKVDELFADMMETIRITPPSSPNLP